MPSRSRVSARRRSPLRTLLRLIIWLAVASLAAALAWVAGNGVRANLAETRSARTLAPPDGHWVDAGDVQMFVQEWGRQDAAVLMLVHGTGAWSGTWFDTPQVLADLGWHVVAVDLPPFGFTQPAGGATAALDYRRVAQAQRLLRAMAAVSNKPVVLVGHSFGAGPALEAAMREPGRVLQLVLVDPALGLGPDGEMPGCPARAARWPLRSRALRTALVESSATVPLFSGWLLRQFVHRPEVVTADKLAEYRRPFRRRHFSAQLGDWAVTFATDDCKDALSVDAAAVATWSRQRRLALIWGAEDTITPPAQGVGLGRLTGTTPAFIADVGHIPHIEDPQAFHAALRAAVGEPPRHRK